MKDIRTQDEKIIAWNEERGLIKTPEELDIANDMSYIVEEVIEALTNMKSGDARPVAKTIVSAIKNGNAKIVADIIEEQGLNETVDGGDEVITPTPEQIVDACCDIKVFSTGTIRKAGYNPDIAMKEVQREIDSRVGSVIEGKFIKDKTPEAVANWYKADFEKAKI